MVRNKAKQHLHQMNVIWTENILLVFFYFVIIGQGVGPEILSAEDKEAIKEHRKKVQGIREVLKRDHMKVLFRDLFPFPVIDCNSFRTERDITFNFFFIAGGIFRQDK